MLKNRSGASRLRLAGGTVCVVLVLGLAAIALGSQAGTAPTDEPESVSGYKVPRFVSLKSDRVNLRSGPSTDYPVKQIYVRKGLPLEVIAETERWRRVRDMDGEVGWVWHTMLDGRRTLLVLGDGTGRPVALRDGPDADALVTALAEPGVLGVLRRCDPEWCLMDTSGPSGWVNRSLVWGLFPDETIE
jgi:SH3-like domain-containing protein